MKTKDIKEVLLYSIKHKQVTDDVNYMLKVASFLGEAFYKNALRALGEFIDKISPRDKTYPKADLTQAHREILKINKQLSSRDEMKSKIDAIAQSCSEKQVGLPKLWKSQKIDCYLYAQTDKYI